MEILTVKTTVLLCCLTYQTFAGPAWNYDYLASVTGPEYWGDVFPTCSGEKQSPINIDSSKAKFRNFSSFHFQNFDRKFGHLVIKNSGSSVVVELPERIVKIWGGGLNHTYWAHSFHFHWGVDKLHGTEHKINGEQFALELHVVHYSDEYASLQHALSSDDHDALAVLGVLFKSSSLDANANHVSDLDEITGDLAEIPAKGTVSLAEDIQLDDFLPRRTDRFYRYYGSLTTPSCDEKVAWTIFSEVISIPDDKIEPFRRILKNGDGLTIINNWRPTQPLNGRSVWASHSSLVSSGHAHEL